MSFYEQIQNRAPLKIFSLLSLHRDEALYEKEISERTKLSTGTVNQVLKDLLDAGMVTVSRKGRLNFYRVFQDLPLVKIHRTWDNLLKLQAVVQELKKHCLKIIFFGSGATGTDTFKSDLDLVLVSDSDPEKLGRIIRKHKQASALIKPVIYSLSDFSELSDDDPAFYNQIKKGVVLHEKDPDNHDKL